MTDPIERLIAEALTTAGLAYTAGDATASKLDFHVPALGIDIEVKRFHSDRIAKQMARSDNVILAQGEVAIRALAGMIAKAGGA